jgi:hypothetical protein
MHRRALLIALSLISSVVVHAAQRVPLGIFTDLGLTTQQIAAIDAGRPVAKVLAWGGPSEVYVFGAVHVEGSPDTYLEAARDVGRLSGTPGYQGVGEIREEATVADLRALAFDPDDVKAVTPHGFYVLTLKSSEQEGLAGVKGSILRKAVVDKTRSSLESELASIKRSVEQSAPRR